MSALVDLNTRPNEGNRGIGVVSRERVGIAEEVIAQR